MSDYCITQCKGTGCQPQNGLNHLLELHCTYSNSCKDAANAIPRMFANAFACFFKRILRLKRAVNKANKTSSAAIMEMISKPTKVPIGKAGESWGILGVCFIRRRSIQKNALRAFIMKMPTKKYWQGISKNHYANNFGYMAKIHLATLIPR